WIGARKDHSKRNKRKFIVRRDPRNISSIIFYDPELQQYFPISYRDPTRPAISLWELRAAQTHLKKQGKSADDEETIFRALESMWAIEKNSKELTLKARRKQERNRLHGLVPKLLPDAKSLDGGPPAGPISPKTGEAKKFDRSQLKPFDED
ncbi:hypothetical protein HCX48_13115, partial [Rhodocyclus tenuis]|nr:hypothetical protein [Rhodocyclus gracilis]